MKWWKKFKKYVNYNEELNKFIKNETNELYNPGEISNNEILDNLDCYYIRENEHDFLKNPLKKDLTENIDFKILNQNCGNLLYNLFGGNEIKRENYKKYFEPAKPIIYPQSIILLVLPQFDKEFGLEKMKIEKTVLIGNNIKNIVDLREDLFNNILIKYYPELQLKNLRFWLANENASELKMFLKFQKINYDKYCGDRNNELQEYNCGIEFPGEILKFRTPENLSFEKVFGKIILVEVSSDKSEFIFKYTKSNLLEICSFCLQKKPMVCKCKCEQVFFFSLIIKK